MGIAPLHHDDLDHDPLAQFALWFATAGDAGIREPEAMALATANTSGEPSVRMVLLKEVDERGFTFFTNQASRKGRELTTNPRAALLFYWKELGRQVRIEGGVETVPRSETETYARKRSRGSQLSALASPQSQVVQDREWLEQRVAELAREHPEDPLPVGESWGGFRVAPDRFEFWQQGDDRLHDRFAYRREPDGGWTIERLAP
jgi:pyridoxamine 5'-phosphate oxidase